MPKKRKAPPKTNRKNGRRGNRAGGHAEAVKNKPNDDIFGFMKGKGGVKILGDIVSPIITPEEWGDLYFDEDPEPKPGSSLRSRRSRR